MEVAMEEVYKDSVPFFFEVDGKVAWVKAPKEFMEKNLQVIKQLAVDLRKANASHVFITIPEVQLSALTSEQLVSLGLCKLSDVDARVIKNTADAKSAFDKITDGYRIAQNNLREEIQQLKEELMKKKAAKKTGKKASKKSSKK